MEKRILGRALLKCKLCGKTKELTIQSTKDDYKHDYSTLNRLGHKCDGYVTTTDEWLGKFELLGIKFDSSVVEICAEDDNVVAFNQPPLKIDWGDDEEGV